MTEIQALTVALSVVISAAILIHANSRITDTKETLRAELALGFERLSNKIDHLAGEVATLKELLSTHLREHHNLN